MTSRSLRVILRNTTTLAEDDRAFVARIGAQDLSDEEFRALLQAHRHTQVDNASLRGLMGLDTLGASQIQRRLRDRGLLELHPAGSQSFYTLAPRLRPPASDDRGEQPADRGEGLDPRLRERIAQLGQRPRTEALRAVLRQLCRGHWRSAAWLAQQLHMAPDKLVERHLSEMVKTGILERRYPATPTPTHADRAYQEIASQVSLFYPPEKV